MQATKSQTSSGKKCKANSNKFSGTKTSLTDNEDVNNSKSIAQRVMDVTNENQNVDDNTNGLLSQCGSSNSIEFDQEVQDITNRAHDLEISKTIITNTNNDNGLPQLIEVTDEQANKVLMSNSKHHVTSESPKFLLDEESLACHENSGTLQASGQLLIANSTSISTISEGLPATCDPLIFRQQQQVSIPKKSSLLNMSSGMGVAPATTKNTNNHFDADRQSDQKEDGENVISLDTRVPHPQSQFRLPAQEEVSYYNDQTSNSLLEPRAGGSLDHNCRPKLLAASMDHKLGHQTPKAATSCQHLQQQLMQQQQHEQQFHHHYHQLQLEQLDQNQPVDYPTFANPHSRQSSSRDYLNDVDEDYDECDPRYHNATVEKRTQKRFQQDTNNNIDSNDDIQELAGQSQGSSGALSSPTSPKAKSAPATPCNFTPTAFHQPNSHLNAMLNPSPANTLPPDIRKNISATCRVLPSSVGLSGQQSANNLSQNPMNLQYLDDLMKRGQLAFEEKRHQDAIESFSQCIELAKNNLSEKQNLAYLRKNFILYGQRAEAHLNLGNFNEAIDDARAARELNPKWTHAYYLQGKSQFLLAEYAASLTVLSFGLAQDPSNRLLFDVLVKCALRAPEFKQDFEPEYKKLESLELDKKPFVVVSVLGQELLSKGHGQHAAIILESALKMGPMDNKKFKGSVLSTISLAYCLMKDFEKAISYQQRELELESELEDVAGQCRVLSNLGYTYYKLRKFDKSLEVHRRQLNLAMRGHLFQQASMALNAIGHVHSARNDYSNALTSHTRCLEILRQLRQVCDNDYVQYKELLAIGHIHSMLNDFKASEERYNEAILLLQRCKDKLNQDDFHIGLIMVKFNFAHVSLKRQAYHEASQYYQEILELSQKISATSKGTLYKMRASNGLGQTFRLCRNFHEARKWFERQLELAKQLKDTVGQSQALCNLGMTCQHFKEHKGARDYFDQNLKLVENKGDPLLRAYALSYMASIYFAEGRINEAQTNYETSANLFKDLDCPAEKKTIDLNMAFVQERVGTQPSELVSSTANFRKVTMAS